MTVCRASLAGAMVTAAVVVVGGGHATLVRFPERRGLCRPMPGAPEGGEPFGDFPEP